MFFKLFDGRKNSGRKRWETNDLKAIEVMTFRCFNDNYVPLIIVSGDIVDGYDSFLSSLGHQLYDMGVIDEKIFEQRRLLSILSGNLPIDTVLHELSGCTEKERSICYISGFHQLEYDKAFCFKLLRGIENKLITNQLERLIILNVPQNVYSYIERAFPKLFSSSIRYIKSS